MKEEQINELEILVSTKEGNKYIIDLENDDRKIIISLLFNYFKDGIPIIEVNKSWIVENDDK